MTRLSSFKKHVNEENSEQEVQKHVRLPISKKQYSKMNMPDEEANNSKEPTTWTFTEIDCVRAIYELMKHLKVPFDSLEEYYYKEVIGENL